MSEFVHEQIRSYQIYRTKRTLINSTVLYMPAATASIKPQSSGAASNHSRSACFLPLDFGVALLKLAYSNGYNIYDKVVMYFRLAIK